MGKRKLPWQYSNAQNMKCGVMMIADITHTSTEDVYLLTNKITGITKRNPEYYMW